MKYRLTARRKAALRKAQLASARKRRRRAVGRVAAGAAVMGAGAYAVSVTSRAKRTGISPRRMARVDMYRAKKKYRRFKNRPVQGRIELAAYTVQKNAWYARKIIRNEFRRLRRRNG